jgi:sugar phosphate isomerase/epimerase
MDMPAYCAEHPASLADAQLACGRYRTSFVVAGSSVKLTSAGDKDREELLNFGDWAETWGIPYVRVFGGGSWGTGLGQTDYDRAGNLINWWREERMARGWRVDLLLETHDAFSGSEPCLRLNQHLSEPMPLIWDSHHTWRVGGESPVSTWDQIGPHVRHVHLKDSVDRPSARHPYTYVLPGEGQMPMGEVIGLMDSERFQGFVSLEWERLWHPYLAPLRDALEQFVQQPWFLASTGEFIPVTTVR